MRCLRTVALTVVGWTLLTLISGTSLSVAVFASTDLTVPPGRTTWPYAMVVGPDNNIWFVEWGGQKVGRITTAGVITEFPVANAQALIGIASGPDGNLWFTDQMAGKVGHMSTSGTNVVQYSLGVGTYPQGITAGPDGNLWFVEQKQTGSYRIGKITTAGAVTSHSTGVNAGTFQAFPATGYGFAVITRGPDGNLWFVNPQNATTGQVGKITTGGAVTFYPTSDLPIGLTSGPDGNLWVMELSHVAKLTTAGVETEYALTSGGWVGIVSGPDGNIWFSETNSGLAKVVPSTGVVTEFATMFPTFEYQPAIVSGPDGNLWFTGEFSSNIGKTNTAGTLLGTFALSAGAATAFNTLGPDGNVWFTQSYPVNGVGKITPTGVVTTYPLLTANAGPSGITAGPDGNLWLLESNVKQIAKVTTSGVVTEYATGGLSFFGITSGPDGNIWFPLYYIKTCKCSAIGRITPAGTISVFPTTTVLSYPFAITSGPDGNLWFLENTSFGAVGKITTAGVVTEYPAQVQNFQNGLVAGPDGALWFAQGYPNSVGRMTTKGVLSTVQLTTLNALGNSLTVGSDHRIWVAEGVAGAMGRLSAIGGTAINFSATHGTQFSGKVASFADGTPSATASNFTAIINWGDGTTSAGTIAGKTGGPFTVSGSHTYSAAGSEHFYVSLHDKVDNSTYTSTKGVATVN